MWAFSARRPRPRKAEVTGTGSSHLPAKRERVQHTDFAGTLVGGVGAPVGGFANHAGHAGGTNAPGVAGGERSVTAAR